MNGADDTERLPSAIGPLVDLALHAYGRTFLLASLLSLGVFVVTGLAELAMPSHMDPNLRVLGLILVELLGCGFVVAVVALSVAADVAGTRLGRRTLLRGAAYRWAGVFGATLFAWATYDLTGLAGAITPDADAGALILAPVTWLLWGAVGLAAPIAALSPDLPVLAAFTAFGRSLMLSLRVVNLSRLAIVAFATVVPLLLETMLLRELTRRGIAYADFWSSVPVDCLVLGPLAALQTVFALDFARRAARIDAQRR